MQLLPKRRKHSRRRSRWLCAQSYFRTWELTTGYASTQVSAEETPFGLSVSFENDESVERNLFMMPNLIIAPLGYSAGVGKSSRIFGCALCSGMYPLMTRSHHRIQVTSRPSFVAIYCAWNRYSTYGVRDEILAVLAGESNRRKESPVPQGKERPTSCGPGWSDHCQPGNRSPTVR